MARITSYYACDRCGFVSPDNKVVKIGGVTVSRCPIHYKRETDQKRSVQKVKRDRKFLTELRRAIESPPDTHW